MQYGDVINTNIDNEEKFITQFLGINTNFKVKNIKIKGDPIKWNKSYKMALPAGIVLGGVGITKLVKLILKNIARKEVSVWECLNQKVQREKTITAKYSQRPGVDKSTHMKFVIPSLMPEKKIYDKRQLQSAIGPK